VAQNRTVVQRHHDDQPDERGEPGQRGQRGSRAGLRKQQACEIDIRSEFDAAEDGLFQLGEHARRGHTELVAVQRPFLALLVLGAGPPRGPRRPHEGHVDDELVVEVEVGLVVWVDVGLEGVVGLVVVVDAVRGVEQHGLVPPGEEDGRVVRVRRALAQVRVRLERRRRAPPVEELGVRVRGAPALRARMGLAHHLERATVPVPVAVAVAVAVAVRVHAAITKAVAVMVAVIVAVTAKAVTIPVKAAPRPVLGVRPMLMLMRIRDVPLALALALLSGGGGSGGGSGGGGAAAAEERMAVPHGRGGRSDSRARCKRRLVAIMPCARVGVGVGMALDGAVVRRQRGWGRDGDRAWEVVPRVRGVRGERGRGRLLCVCVCVCSRARCTFHLWCGGPFLA
jgi:hypothetical protein